ncbi:MAG: hypothetical protein AAFR81_20765 [Chloroflexota bacterium]
MTRRVIVTIICVVIAIVGIAYGFWQYTLQATPLSVSTADDITEDTVENIGEGIPDGNPPRDLLVMSDVAGDWDLVLLGADGSVTNLTADDSGAQDIFGAYDLAGQTINWLANRSDPLDLGPMTMNADGTEQAELSIMSAIMGYVRQGKFDWDAVWSPDGRMIAWSSVRDVNLEIYTVAVTEDGTLDIDDATRQTNRLPRDWYASWSPDGTRLAFNSDDGGNENIYTIDLATGDITQLTTHEADDLHGFWGYGDANREVVYFISEREVLVADVEGIPPIYQWDSATGEVTTVPSDAQFTADPVWSPAGTHVAYMSNEGENGNWGVYVSQADGNNLRRVTPDNANYMFAVWVP